MTPTRLELELYLLGDLEEARRTELDALLASDPALRQRLERIRAEASTDVPMFVPPAGESSDVRPANQPWRWALALVAAAVVLFAVAQWPERPGGVQYRGAFELDVQVVRAGTVKPVGAVWTSEKGDLLQWTVASETNGFLLVLDLQDDGVHSVWKQATLQAGRSVQGSVVLDGYAGAERVYFVVSDAPIDVAALQLPSGSALIEADTIELSADQRSILLTGAP